MTKIVCVLLVVEGLSGPHRRPQDAHGRLPRWVRDLTEQRDRAEVRAADLDKRLLAYQPPVPLVAESLTIHLSNDRFKTYFAACGFPHLLLSFHRYC